MKNILNRVKLLMEYDTSKTLSENILILEIVSTVDDLLRGLNKLRNAGVADDIFKRAGIQSVDTAGNVVAINSLDDFVKFGRNMTPVNLGKVQSKLLKSTLPIADKAKYIENYVAKNIKGGYGKSMNTTQISDDLVNRAGFPKDVADDIANKMTSHYSGVKPIGTTPQKLTGANDKIKKTRRGGQKRLKRQNAENPTNTTPNQIQQITDEVVKGPKSWREWVKWGAGLGIGALALWWFFHDSDENVPDDIPENEPIPVPNPEPINSDKCASYTVCSGEYKKCCKSPVIAKVQGCLGGLKTDGKFGPLTQEALSNKNFPNGFTDKDVAVICNEVQPSPEDKPQTNSVNVELETGSNEVSDTSDV